MKVVIVLFCLFCQKYVTACASTIPTGLPQSNCCSVDVADTTSTGRFLFNPALSTCPTDATFICSISADGSTATTQVVINGNQVIASGAGGTNSMATITCDLTDKQWKYQTTTVVETIGCTA